MSAMSAFLNVLLQLAEFGDPARHRGGDAVLVAQVEREPLLEIAPQRRRQQPAQALRLEDALAADQHQAALEDRLGVGIRRTRQPGVVGRRAGLDQEQPQHDLGDPDVVGLHGGGQRLEARLAVPLQRRRGARRRGCMRSGRPAPVRCIVRCLSGTALRAHRLSICDCSAVSALSPPGRRSGCSQSISLRMTLYRYPRP